MEQLTTLQKNIIEQLGHSVPDLLTNRHEREYLADNCKDVYRWGARVGVGGFQYSHELLGFYENNEKLIVDNLYQSIESFSFSDIAHALNCIENPYIDDADIIKVLLVGTNEERQELQQSLVLAVLDKETQEIAKVLNLGECNE